MWRNLRKRIDKCVGFAHSVQHLLAIRWSFRRQNDSSESRHLVSHKTWEKHNPRNARHVGIAKPHQSLCDNLEVFFFKKKNFGSVEMAFMTLNASMSGWGICLGAFIVGIDHRLVELCAEETRAHPMNRGTRFSDHMPGCTQVLPLRMCHRDMCVCVLSWRAECCHRDLCPDCGGLSILPECNSSQAPSEISIKTSPSESDSRSNDYQLQLYSRS